MNAEPMQADPAKLDAFVGKMLSDLGAAFIVPLVRIGDELGLYRVLQECGPVTPSELAVRTGTAERYIREWLSAHAAAGYLEYQPADGRFRMTAEQAAVFADAESPANMLGAFEIASANVIDAPKVAKAFRTGGGLGWHEHSQCLFSGTERLFRPGYNANLISTWLPSLEGVVERLARGGAVAADIGCGHGASTILMAKAFPHSQFVGFDSHAASIEQARQRAGAAGLDSASSNLRFEVASAKEFPGRNYDLIACFDCLHDMGDPVGAARHVRQALAPDGTWMIVEPFAGDRIEDNFTPVGRLFYAGSTMVCTPASLAQEVGLALGAQAGSARLADVLREGGFTRIRKAAETPFNLVLEARL